MFAKLSTALTIIIAVIAATTTVTCGVAMRLRIRNTSAPTKGSMSATSNNTLMTVCDMWYLQRNACDLVIYVGNLKRQTELSDNKSLSFL